MTESTTFQRIKDAVLAGRVRLSDHALTRMLERNIDILSALDGLSHATIVKDYSLSRGTPRVLVSQREPNGRVLHVVWDAPENDVQDAVLVTVYHPDR